MPIVVTTPTSALANFTTPTNAHDYATSSHATAPLSMGPFNAQTSALVPEVHVPNVSAPQVFAAVNNAGVGFDSSRVDLNMPLQELLPDFAQGSYGIQGGDMYGIEGGDSYGMAPLPSSYQGGGSSFINPGGDSYGMQPLPSSYRGGGNHFANINAGAAYGMVLSNNGVNAGAGYYADPTNGYGMPPSLILPAMDGFQDDDAA
ncbi:hypothetical protein B0H19DRAFT_1252301 [Mycena capillaripes]|nr:hypothetical protein B0H19DRAFT_1252301 [Mycena capillaripes]